MGLKTTTYSYTATFALPLCESPANIGRIWMNKKLVHDPNANPTTDPIPPLAARLSLVESKPPDRSPSK